MARSTMTRRTAPPRPTAEKGEPEVLDLGAFTLTKGSPVRARTVGGDDVVGKLVVVGFKDGEPHTAAVWVENRGARWVYVDTVEPVTVTA